MIELFEGVARGVPAAAAGPIAFGGMLLLVLAAAMRPCRRAASDATAARPTAPDRIRPAA